MLLQRSLMARLEQWNVGILLGCLAQNLDLPPEIAFGCKPAFGLSNQLRCTLAIRVLNIELECAEKSMPGEANEHLVASLESSTEVARLVERTGFRQSFRGAPGSFANALVQSTQFGSVRFGIGARSSSSMARPISSRARSGALFCNACCACRVRRRFSSTSRLYSCSRRWISDRS